MKTKVVIAVAALGVIGVGVLVFQIVMQRGGGPSGPVAPVAPPAATWDVDPSGATYAGTASCVSCHETEHRAWLGSHHDLAMQEATDETVLGDFDDATLEANGITSTFFRRDDAFVVRTDGPDGLLRDYPVAYTFGVEPLQQYLIELDGGRLQALSLCWDARPAAQGGQRWFHLYPDETIHHDDELHWTRTSQNWNFTCAECHSTNLEKNYDLAEDRFDTTWSEIDVGCEACHGPASVHVLWARSHAAGADAGRAPPRGLGLVNPLKDTDGGRWMIDPGTGNAARTLPRTSDAQLETCARCHSRRSPIADYEHGRPLLDTHRLRVLDEGLYFADGQIDGEVYVHGSFLQSVMHQRGVTCGDCHDPHRLKLRAPGNAVCQKCHQPDVYDTPRHHHHPPGPGASCAACHMPERTYMVVDPRRDHSIRVPRPDIAAAVGAPDACTGCHRDQSPQWAADALIRWYGPERLQTPHYGETLHRGRLGAPGAAARLQELVANGEQPGIVRATALSLLRGYPSADTIAAAEAALRDDDPLVRLHALELVELAGPESRWRLAGHLLDDPVRAVRAEAGRVIAAVPSTVLNETQRRRSQTAVDQYVASQMVSAERPESHLNVGLVHLAAGRLDDAEAAYRTALRLDPAFVPASVNLADLMRARGRDRDGEVVLRSALSTTPDAAAAHHALGLLKVRTGRLPEAIASLRLGAELAPGAPRHAFAYAIALDAVEQTPEGIRVLVEALARHPYDRDILGALVSMHHAQGDAAAAAGYASRLAELDRSP